VTSLTSAGIASRSLADQLTFRFRASDWLLALPVAFSGLTHWGADSLRGFTLSAAVGWGADSLTLGAILLLTQILGASNIALWFIAVNLAFRTFSLLAVNLALGTLADGVANSRTHGIIALPSALRMAVTFDFSDSLHEVSLSSNEADGEEGEE
jgi:hypothetical protein